MIKKGNEIKAGDIIELGGKKLEVIGFDPKRIVCKEYKDGQKRVWYSFFDKLTDIYLSYRNEYNVVSEIGKN